MVERNTDLFFQVADTLDLMPHRYDQDTFGRTESSCGSVHCIAGWAAILSGKAEFRSAFPDGEWRFYKKGTDREVDPGTVAMKALGLTETEATVLFEPWWEPFPRSDDEWESPAHSVAEALRHIGKGDPISEHTVDTSWMKELRTSERRRGILPKTS